jgi:hypothetical protein
MITVEVKGLRELQARFDRLPEEIRIETVAAVENGAKVFVAGAKRDAPVDFGVLRNGISYSPLAVSKTNVSFEVISNAR